MMYSLLLCLLAISSCAFACETCPGSTKHGIHSRLVRRQQPESRNAVSGPRGPLEWGQLNFLHTTDTHAWLEGHLKEQNCGADWGDFLTPVRTSRSILTSIESAHWILGDTHDGAGISDATSPNGNVSLPIFEQVDYDLLAIGNHELYLTDIAYLTHLQFAKFYGERFVTSNVYIRNNATGKFDFIGHPYRYFTTKLGLRVMAFGVLFDFTGNTNVTKVVKAMDMIKESWFIDAVNTTDPVDLVLVIGHNPARSNVSSSTFGSIHSAIRSMRPETPIQLFGGHNHIRDFQIYDSSSTALGSGRYCETLGWLSMSGIGSKTFHGNMEPQGVPNPTKKAIKVPSGSNDRPSSLVYSRRYLDWNRLTFAYHAKGSQDSTFDTRKGLNVSKEITVARKTLNLTELYGCAPQTYCMTCQPLGSNGSIYGLILIALAAVVVNKDRAKVPRLITTNTGSIRFDLVQGPFTFDDAFIVSPFLNKFLYVPDVPYSQASKVLDILNAGPYQKKRDVLQYDAGLPALFNGDDGCTNRATASGPLTQGSLRQRSVTRRRSPPPFEDLTPGYTTTNDFGNDGDDTPHSNVPQYKLPNDVQANASFPTDGSDPKTVDFIFVDFIADKFVLPALNAAKGTDKSGGGSGKGNYTMKDVKNYMPAGFTSRDFLPAYARKFWSSGPRCPVS